MTDSAALIGKDESRAVFYLTSFAFLLLPFDASANPLRRLLANAVNHLKPAALDELAQVFERRDFELTVERRGGLDADALDFEQVEHACGRLRRQVLPRLERAALQKLHDLRAQATAHARNRLQAFDAFFTRDSFNRRRPRLDHLRRVAIRAHAK